MTDKFPRLMEYEKNSMYPSSSDNLGGSSPALLSQGPLELQDEGMDCTVPQQQEVSQLVPGQSKEDSETKNRRQRLRIWSYHCQVPNAEVDKKSKLTEAAKLLSAEEMQRLNEDIFNPLDICWIISKNSEISAKN